MGVCNSKNEKYSNLVKPSRYFYIIKCVWYKAVW